MKNVLKLSEATSLALHAMCLMAKETERLLSVKEISSHFEVSAHHLSKVLQKLVKAKLVKSTKGYGGGFQLNRNPERITFLEIYEAIEGESNESYCLLNKTRNCSKCIMGDLLYVVNKQTEDYFRKTNLLDFQKR